VQEALLFVLFFVSFCQKSEQRQTKQKDEEKTNEPTSQRRTPRANKEGRETPSPLSPTNLNEEPNPVLVRFNLY